MMGEEGGEKRQLTSWRFSRGLGIGGGDRAGGSHRSWGKLGRPENPARFPKKKQKNTGGLGKLIIGGGLLNRERRKPKGEEKTKRKPN